jgi:hypothetical protein
VGLLEADERRLELAGIMLLGLGRVKLLQVVHFPNLSEFTVNLRDAEIVSTSKGEHLLACRVEREYRRIVDPPGDKLLGYLEATDEEIGILQRASYELPDWRLTKLVELMSTLSEIDAAQATERDRRRKTYRTTQTP